MANLLPRTSRSPRNRPGRSALEVDEALIDRLRFHKDGAIQLGEVEIARVASVGIALHDRQERLEGESE